MQQERIKMCVVKVLILLKILIASECANILFLNGVPSKSHLIWNRPIVNALASRGHNVTVLSVDVDYNPQFPDNTYYIGLEKVYPTLYNSSNDKNDIAKRSQENPFESILSFYKFGYMGCKGAVASHGFKKLLTYSPNAFDLIIYDFTCGPCLLGFLHHFNYPALVSVTAFNIPQFTHNLIGGSKSYSSVPHFTLRYASQMDFKQRIVNFVVHSFDQFYRNYVFLPRLQKMTQPLFLEQLPTLDSLERKTQILLANSNQHVDFTENLNQFVIPVGGLQIVKPNNISEELETFVEKSKKGFVLFSLGTNVKASVLGSRRFHMFYSALSQIEDYNFLWKLDQDNFTTEIATNVKIMSWLPQSDLLGHKKIRAFITHCGLLSVHEAYWMSVPLIGIPVYVDQHRNCFKAKLDGVAKVLKFNELSVDLIRNTILEVLTNESYLATITEKSRLFRDQRELPLNRAIWWIEWALRHPKIISTTSQPSLNNMFQSNSLDVILFLIFIIACLVYLVYSMFRKLVRLLLKFDTVGKNQRQTKKTE